MSLVAFLLIKAIADSVDVARGVAATAQTAAAAAQVASSVAAMKREKQAQSAYARASSEKVAQAVPVYDPKEYERNLFLAKVAMLSYISKADHIYTYEERVEFDNTLAIAASAYGNEVAEQAKHIIDFECNNFMSLENYLQKVHERDLDPFVFYSEEYARTDNQLTPEEEAALQKLKAYIESRKGKKSFNDLTCAKCGGAMHADAYGYKATCGFCGYEIVLNIDNSPYKTSTLKCSSCGASFEQYRNSANFSFCTYCGGRVVSVPVQTAPVQKAKSSSRSKKESNLYISYNSVNPGVGMVTRIVSTGKKNTYVNGQTVSFRLPKGPQTIVLKIGRINYNRNIVIPENNSPVRIYASFNGRAHISIDQPPC